VYPVLTTLSFHGVTRPIGSYGLMLVLALVCGSLLTLRNALRAGWDEGAVIAALASALGAGFVGACVLSIVVSWAITGSLVEGLARPGIVYYGGLCAGGLGLWRCSRAFGLSGLGMLDLALPGLPVGHALGRIGCLLGGCCYGKPTSAAWGVHLMRPTHGKLWTEPFARHPWPVYEAACLVLLALVFWPPQRAARFEGRRAALYVASYACVRFALEPLRDDAIRGVFFTGLLSTSQVLSLMLLILALGFLWMKSPRAAQAVCDEAV